MEGDWSSGNSFAYRYNGKEKELGLGLGYLNYGAREYDPAVSRWLEVDPQSQRYSSISPYAYVANRPTIAIDPNGEEIIIVNNGNAQQVVRDLGAIYATRRGRAIIDRLASSNTKYYINGGAKRIRGGYFVGSRYDRIRNNLRYSQKEELVDGVYNPSYITLGHELYHAYQDETKSQRNYPKQTEADAMKFENYLRDVFDQGPHRTNHDGIPHLSSVTAFDSFGEKVDISSIKVKTEIFGGSNSPNAEGGIPIDNIGNGTSISPMIANILSYMNKNGLQQLNLKFDQRDKKNKKVKRP